MTSGSDPPGVEHPADSTSGPVGCPRYREIPNSSVLRTWGGASTKLLSPMGATHRKELRTGGCMLVQSAFASLHLRILGTSEIRFPSVGTLGSSNSIGEALPGTDGVRRSKGASDVLGFYASRLFFKFSV